MRHDADDVAAGGRDATRERTAPAGSGLITARKDFQWLLGRAQKALRAGHPAEAAAWAEVAALHLVTSPCGWFANAELEDLVTGIGRDAVGRGRTPEVRPRAGEALRILHVATAVATIGGVERLIRRWIDSDPARSHSVVLTRQLHPVPPALDAAARRTGGSVIRLDTRPGGLLSRARRLRDLAAGFDLVLLYVGNRDVVPAMAFAQAADRPPTLYVDHADHLFWLGVSITDWHVALRQSGRRLAVTRRGIPPSRSLLLPIILEPLERSLPRVDAKRALGLPEDCLVVLSVARAVKYRTMDGRSFADAHLPFLKAHPEAVLVVIGPGPREDWRAAAEASGGRIVVHPERPDTAVFYDAADIYVDSYPFVSTTSLLEAGCRGVPVVSRFPWSSDSGVLGTDMPGLDGLLIRTFTEADHTATLGRLANRRDERERLGQATRDGILAAHLGPNWCAARDEIYARALAGDTGPARAHPPSRPRHGELDALLPQIHGAPSDPLSLLASELALFPWRARIALAFGLLRRRGADPQIRRLVVRRWVPHWIAAAARTVWRR